MGDILFLAHRVPYPPDRGDKIRGFHLLKHLAAKHRVHLVGFADDPADLEDRPGLIDLAGERAVIWRAASQVRAAAEALAKRRPVSLTAFADAALRRSVADMLDRHDIETIFVFSGQMAQYLPPNPRQRVIMDFVDMDSAKFDAYAKGSAWPMSWMLRREARLLGQFEKAVAARVDASLFVSEAEAALFRETTGAGRVHAVENGIDTCFFDPAAEFRRVKTMGRLIVFTGQMDYRPNIEGVAWFAEAMLPQIRRAHPDVRFAIVGRNPTEAVRALTRHPGVVVTGAVDDVRGWLAAASVVVAPLKLARGVQNKVLEGMAMARPIVASVAAAEGIDHAGTIRLGSSASEIAETVVRLLEDQRGAAALGAAARAQVIARYSWDARLAALDALLEMPKPGETEEPPRRRSAA